MDIEDVFAIVKYVIVVALVTLAIWGVGKIFAESVKSYEVISPKDGVECIVVSRMFNTSVDCWTVE